MPNKTIQHNEKLETTLYHSFSERYKGKTEKEIASIIGTTITTVSGIKLKRNKLSFSRLSQIVKIFPELEECIIKCLQGNTQVVDNKRIDELTKEEKIAIIKNLLDSL